MLEKKSNVHTRAQSDLRICKLTISVGRSQFHQHFTQTFFVPKCFLRQNVTRETLREALLYEKLVRKMLMKLTPAQLVPTISNLQPNNAKIKDFIWF